MNRQEVIRHTGTLRRSTLFRAGYDIVIHEDLIIPSHTTIKFKTNIRFPYGVGYNVGIITLRSSYQNSGLMLPASGGVGILDPDYKDYIFLTIQNIKDTEIIIPKNKAFAQIVFVPVSNVQLLEVI